MPMRNIFEIKGLRAKANKYIMAPIERNEALKNLMYSMS
jgi:hypothetical protein